MRTTGDIPAQSRPGNRCADGAKMKRDVTRLKGITRFATLLVWLILSGCSSGITTHDEIRAAELVVDFLSSLQTEQGIRTAYDWTDDGYKAEVPLDEFIRIIASIRSRNSGADIRLAGYEIFGSREMIVVYADSETSDGRLFFKFSLAGSKHKDYYLRYLEISDAGYGKDGLYRDFRESVVVEGV